MDISEGFNFILNQLSTSQQTSLRAVRHQSGALLDCNPRFKYFTLHGISHIDSLFNILRILLKGGINLSQEEIFLLSLALCTHDLGMVIALGDKDNDILFDGKPQLTDLSSVEDFVRRTHHNLVASYYQKDFNFLTSLGITPQHIGVVREISRLHRQIPLADKSGLIKNLGALMRVIDELDLSAQRAPYNVLETLYPDMDATSCWHWFKHNIVEGWTDSLTVEHRKVNNQTTIQFKIQVHPANKSSIPYWLKQISQPIIKALEDDGAASIIKDKWGVNIEVITDEDGSYTNDFGIHWRAIEERALSSGRKVIMVIDDEYRKIEDLFLPLMDDFHVVVAADANDAFKKLSARSADLVLVDMQIPSGGRYSAAETEDFKSTGSLICRDINSLHPTTKVVVLTATKHPLPSGDLFKPNDILTKPIDPLLLLTKVKHYLLS